MSTRAAATPVCWEPGRGTWRRTGMRPLSLFGMVVTIGLSAALTGCGSDSDRPVTSDAGGPITVEQLLARSSDTPVAVQGLLHVERGVARLSATVLESYPPQCGEPSVELVGLELRAVEGTTTAEEVSWKEGAVLNLERAADGRFAVVDVDTESRSS